MRPAICPEKTAGIHSFFYKNVGFPAEVEHSYVSVDVRL